MFETGLSMKMVARHFMPQASAQEREEHHHHYVVEAIVRGSRLNDSGYLVDIIVLREALSAVLDRYRDRLLNDLPEFRSCIPTMENLAVEIWKGVRDTVGDVPEGTLTVRIWEDSSAWACFEDRLG